MRFVSTGSFNPLCESAVVMEGRVRVPNPEGMSFKTCMGPYSPQCCCDANFQISLPEMTHTIIYGVTEVEIVTSAIVDAQLGTESLDSLR